MPEVNILTEQEQKKFYSLDEEAKRLLEFRKNNIKKNNLTPCPQCATWININARKCPQCTSDIAEHTQRVREELKKLELIFSELYEIHKKKMELYHQGSSYKSFWKRVGDFFTDGQLLNDFKIVIPILVGFFVLILFLGSKGYQLAFWPVALGGGAGIFYLFKRWKLKKFVMLDFYRTVLVFGLCLILFSAVFSQINFWPPSSTGGKMTVSGSVIKLREAPTTNSDMISMLYAGQKLTVLQKRNAWYKVRTEEGKTGWVHSQGVSR